MDETALDLGLKIVQGHRGRSRRRNAVDPGKKKLIVEMVEQQGRLGRKNGKGFYDYPEKGRPEERVAGPVGPAPQERDPDTIDVEELKQRFLVMQAVEAARTFEEGVITDRARPMSARSSALASRRSPAAAVLHRLHGHQEVRRALPHA